MASRAQEIVVGRIIACFAPGRGGSPRALTQLARQLQAELLGLFIEDIDLVRLAALPLAAEVGSASAMRRALDPAAIERALQAEASRLRQSLAVALGSEVAWSFRVTRASPVEAVAAALGESRAASLLIPPGCDPRAAREVLRRSDLGAPKLRLLLAAAQPVLILPE